MGQTEIALSWHVEQRRLNDLVPLEKNPFGKIDARKKKRLEEKIKALGVFEAPTIDTDNVLLTFNKRHMILLELGHGEDLFDVMVPNRPLTENERKEIIIASNIHEGNWIEEILKEEFGEMDLASLGLELDFADAILEETSKKKTDQEPVFPIVAQFSEKHDAIIIVSDNEIDTNFLKQILQAGENGQLQIGSSGPEPCDPGKRLYQPMELKIIIVSHKRPDRVITTRAVAGCAICVPESQAADYTRHNPGVEIIAHPDSVVGLPAKRQWILENFSDVFMLDDDLKEMRAVHRPAGEKQKVDPETARQIILATAQAARNAGAYLFGFNQSVIPAAYNGLQPISLTGYMIEGWIGVLSGSKLFYPRDMRLCGDFWISCLNAYYHRICYKDLRFSFVPTNTFCNQGGQSEFRNIDAEKQAYEFLVEHFGGDVVQLKKDTGLAKRKHQYQKTLKLPF